MPRTQQNQYEEKFYSVTKSNVEYMNAKREQSAILDLALANKKAQLAQKKLADKDERKSLKEWGTGWVKLLKLRILQHKNRKDDLAAFVAGQKEERDEIESSLNRAMKTQRGFKESYIKAVKKNDTAWFAKADEMGNRIDAQTKTLREKNNETLTAMRREQVAKQAQNELAKRDREEAQKEAAAREAYENSFYEETPKKKSVAERIQAKFSSNQQARGQAQRSDQPDRTLTRTDDFYK